MRFCASVFLLLAAVLAGRARAQSLADVARQEAERRKAIKTEAKVYTNKDLRPIPAAESKPPDPAATPAPVPGGTAPTTSSDVPENEKDGPQSGDAARPPSDATSPHPDLTAGGGTNRDPADWSSRLKALQTTLDRDQTYLDALQSRINALTTDFVNRDDPVQRSTIANARQKAIAELERLEKQIEDDRAAIVSFQEEARRAGVPPGWLR